MQRQNITEERFDEILMLAHKISSMIGIMCSDIDENEKYIIITLLFTVEVMENIQDNENAEKECLTNLMYVRELIDKKANSCFPETKNG